ncbi:hypothetical protein ADU85_01920, partial [Clostridium botulinum]|uniref:hypothetical protein n=1 Tax=Clostridium botulinum TaxID=1491 RepID=UPI0006A4B17C
HPSIFEINSLALVHLFSSFPIRTKFANEVSLIIPAALRFLSSTTSGKTIVYKSFFAKSLNSSINPK